MYESIVCSKFTPPCISGRSTLEYGREEELEALVERASMRANAHLLRLMLDTYLLRQHCLNLKQVSVSGYVNNASFNEAKATSSLTHLSTR